MRAAVEEQIERESLALFMTGRVYDDGIIDPRDTRTVLGICLSAVHNDEVRGARRLRRVPDVMRPGCHRGCAAGHPGGSDGANTRMENVINAVLIANRGEIACRIARTCRRLGIGTVAVFSDADADALHVARLRRRRAPAGHGARRHVPARRPAVDAARRAGADAVHPGYGFLAESADFARAVIDAGLTWIGPPPDGDRRDGLEDRGQGADARRRRAGAARLHRRGRRRPAAIGFPLLVKASAGGGGRGMRIVRIAGRARPTPAPAPSARPRRRSATAPCSSSATSSAAATSRSRSSPTPTATSSSLHERECSIQRRHQKIVEESPSPAVDAELRRRMADAAVAAARAVGYVGAGTVEFLLDPDGGFWFLEMNTRLQVEHPVTELVTGLDLVELQLAVAEGEPLPDAALRRPARRPRHRGPPHGRGPGRRLPPVDGHVHPLRRSPGDVRVDTGIDDRLDGVAVLRLDGRQGHRPRADPRRGRSARSPARSRGARLHGPVTNRDQLLRVLEHRGVPRRRPAHRLPRRAPVHRAASPATSGSPRRPWPLAEQAANRAAARRARRHPVGWRNNPAVDQRVELALDDAPRDRDATGSGATRHVDRRRRAARRRSSSAPDPTRSCSTSPACGARYDVGRDGDRRFVDADDGHVDVRRAPPPPRPDRRRRRRLARRPDAGHRAARARRAGRRRDGRPGARRRRGDEDGAPDPRPGRRHGRRRCTSRPATRSTPASSCCTSREVPTA